MVNFRRMKIGDLDSIYKDQEIRSIITTSSPNKPKFAVVIEENNHIQGGASGYIMENAALLQNIVVKQHENSTVYKDGLIRAMIHFLELDGMDFLIVRDEDTIYTDIGFHLLQEDESFSVGLVRHMEEEFANTNSIYWIALKNFFKERGC